MLNAQVETQFVLNTFGGQSLVVGGYRFMTAYKRWLCAVHLPFYHAGDVVRPCIDFCDNVAKYCPFFRPHGESQIGEPGFLCKNTFNDPTTWSSDVPDTCCYRPCHVVAPAPGSAPAGDCPPLASVTSRCNNTSNSVKPLTPDLITCLSLCLLASWIHKTVLQYNCIGPT